MRILKFSICKDIQEDIKPYETVTSSFLDSYQDRNMIKFHITPWETYKEDLKAIALNGNDVDISQVASPQINDLILMGALRPFTQQEIASMGGISAFPSVAWNLPDNTKEIYAIPWIIDARAILYRREILEEAGIDETTAFTSFDNMENTFERLQAKGFETPWAVGTGNKYTAFQTACCWIWGLGGEIGKEDKILIDQPETIEALVRYFKMYRFMPKHGQNPNHLELWKMFRESKVAAIMHNISIHSLSRASENGANIGATLAPGPTYVGGSSLVVWRHSRQPEQAVGLIQHLTTSVIQLQFALLSGSMPARSYVLNDTHFTKTPNLRVFVDSIAQGRTYSGLRFGGLLEELLSAAICNVWEKIIADPGIDIKSTLLSEIEPVVSHINSLKS
jgi:multiple sugar transport system substrate-binding protein